MARNKAQRARYQNFAQTANYFNNTYGRDDTKLEMWQRLCQDVNVPEGSSIRQCKKALQRIYINIGEFVAAHNEGRSPRVFHSYKALQKHLEEEPGAKFPMALAKENPILKWMLVKL